MAGPPSLARAAIELQPLMQGNLDGLCGLYAIINALRVAVYPEHVITTRMSKRLLECGLGVLGRKGKLKHTIINGIDSAVWLLLCQAIIAEAETLVGCRIAIAHLVAAYRPWRTRDLVRSINKAVNEQQPVLICLEGRLNHWSVIVGVTATRLVLFDSANCRWISTKSLTVSSRLSGRPRFVAREGAIALSCSRWSCIEPPD